MSLPGLSKSDLENFRNESEIIRLTAQQVIKDFALFGMDITFSGDTINAYNELFDQLDSSLVELLNSDYRRLLSLLYHIDISEKELNQKLAAHNRDHSAVIAEMILERELKKVIIRKFYRG